MRRWAVTIIGLILVIVLSILVWDKQPTIYPYLFLSLTVAALLAYSIISYKEQQSSAPTILFILIICLFLRSVPFIATHYGILPMGDVSYEYAVINTFSDEGRIFVIPGESLPQIRLTWYSSWPALHSLSLIFSTILDVDPYFVPMILPLVFSLVGFLFLYLLLHALATGLKLNRVVIPLGLLLYAISPEAIYFGYKFVAQSLGVMLVLVEFYLLYKYIQTHDLRIGALIILNAVLIVVTHHYTSFIFAGYLLIFSALALASGLLFRAWRRREIWSFRREPLFIGMLGLIMAGSIFLWWSEVGTVIAGTAASGASSAAAVLTGGEEFAPHLPATYYPEELVPPWANLLWVRDFLIYIPVFFGFGWLLWERAKKKSAAAEEPSAFGFLAISLVCFGGIFLFELFVSHIEPYRVVLIGLPFIALGSGVLYIKFLSKSKWAVLIVLVLITTTSFLGLWGHRYAPIHFYSSSVSAEEVGEFMPFDERHWEAQGFLVQNFDLEEKDRILSDAPHLALRLLPPQMYEKMAPLTGYEIADALSQALAENEDLVVIDFGASLYSHYWGKRTPSEAKDIRVDFDCVLSQNLTKIYDNDFAIWVSEGKP